MDKKQKSSDSKREKIENNETEFFNFQFSTFNSDDDKVIYIPDEEYHRFMRSFHKIEEAQRELHKIRGGMEENGELKIEN